MKTHHLFTLTSLAAALLGPAQAALADSTDTASLSPVEVTATRTPVTEDDTLAATTIISRDQISTSSARDVGDLLRDYAGVDVVRTGGIGQQTSIFMRGANSNQTLVLVDGIRLNNDTSGLASIQNLRPDDIDHIEIVKGPRSTLYGADAIGGVINIITRRPDATSTSLNLTAGGEHTLAGEARQDFRSGAYSGSLHAGGLNTEGYPVFAGEDSTIGYKNQDAGLNLGYKKDDLDLNGQFQSNSGRDQYLSGGPLDQNFNDTLGSLQARYQVSPDYVTTLRLSAFHDHLNQNEPEGYPYATAPYAYDFAYNTRREADWQNDYTLPSNNLVTIGGTYREEKVSELSYGLPYDTTLGMTAGFIQDQFQYQQFSAQVGGRVEHDTDFGQHETGSLTLGWAFGKNDHAYANLSTGFHAPSADQLYSFDGNPLLRPEQSVNRELGLRHDDGLFNAQAALFENDVRDLIQGVETQAPSAANNYYGVYQYLNVDRAHIRGGELAFGVRKNGWSWQNQASYTQALDAITEQELLRRPRRQLSSNLDYQQSRYDLGANAVAQSRSLDFNQFVLPGYAVYNLHAGVQIVPQLSLRLNVDNVANKRYSVYSDYDLNGVQSPYVAQPRLVSVSVRLTF